MLSRLGFRHDADLGDYSRSVFGYGTPDIDQFPNVDFPVVTVAIANPVTSAAKTKRDITEKVKSAVNAISGVNKIRPSSVEGVSKVNIHFCPTRASMSPLRKSGIR